MRTLRKLKPEELEWMATKEVPIELRAFDAGFDSDGMWDAALAKAAYEAEDARRSKGKGKGTKRPAAILSRGLTSG